MSLLVVGLSHRSAPAGLLERAALTGHQPSRLLHASASAPVAESTLVNTCNRIELYAEVDNCHAGVEILSTLLAEHSGVGLDELTPHLYVHYEDRAVHHLFSVACGLHSMVVGEGQILGQLRDALNTAQDQHTAGRSLNELFQQALRVGKRAHSETGIDKAGQTLVIFGLQQIAEVCGPIAGKRALVVGAGSMSSLAAATLHGEGVGELVVANRTLAKAERVAAQLGGTAVPFTELGTALVETDLVISCTGAAGIVLTADAIEAAAQKRSAVAAPLALLDLAMPRDVDTAAHTLAGVHVVYLESLATAAQDADSGALDIDAVRRIVAEEVDAFGAAQRAAATTPSVIALRAMASALVNAELERLDARLPGLEDHTRAEIQQTVRRVVNKLLHQPTVRIKQLAGEPGGASYAAALRELFDLDPMAIEAVSTTRTIS
ncbi:glutamyl-tRNA reductase [Streptomyces sp. NBC_01017]|uniref:glutamyl-tRNA reductase n=1 Tax=Streptomyces sp. NBC_01017 TaxID=2903721 RepID=UPI003863DDB0|nr:glutamyl-tRNA reductase [Streptomyces sp. NBC_01017]WSV35092.1 glutamyl-tRNA reductase [Streptomyces sp. NBC_01017]